MLDTYDSLEWEKNDNEDEDAEVIGACDSDKRRILISSSGTHSVRSHRVAPDVSV